jgi:restriction endonuclease S subunit
LRKKDFIDGKYMVIGGGKKHSGYHNNYNREENTILCSGTGSYAGYISRYNTKVWASEAFSIHSVDLNILNEDYLFLFLVSIQDKIYKSRPASGGQPHMYPKTLQSKIKIPLPSLEIQEQCITLFEQKKAYIESIDKKIAEHKNYLEELKTLAKDVITSFC